MKVGMITTWRTDCGIAGYSEALVAALAQHGVDVEIALIDRFEHRYMTHRELHAEHRRIAEQASECDVVHVQHEFGFFAGAYGYTSSLRTLGLALARIDKPLVLTLHTEPHPFLVGGRSWAGRMGDRGRLAAWFALVNAQLARRRDRVVIAHTRTARRQLADAGIPMNQIRLVRQGVRAGSVPAPGSDEALAARERLGISRDDVVLTCFGFLAHHKGADIAASALLDLPENYRLLVVGGAHPYEADRAVDELLAVIANDDDGYLTERVSVTGRVALEELRDYHAATDICLAPYRPVPRVLSSAAITWALASGRPVIASRVPAFVELAHEAGCLQLVHPEAPHELAWAAQRLAEDPERSAELVANALDYAAKASWDEVARSHAAIYAEVAAARSSTPSSVAAPTSQSAQSGNGASGAGAPSARSIPSRKASGDGPE